MITLDFFTDPSASPVLGFGCYYNKRWTFSQWITSFIRKYEPNIEFLELFALLVATFTWSNRLRNMRFTVFCDNEAVVTMVNNQTQMQKLHDIVKKLIKRELQFNMRVFAKHVFGKFNEIADSLSRLQFKCFHQVAP